MAQTIRLGATLAAQYVGMGERGFYNLVERGDIKYTTDPETGRRQFALSDLEDLKIKRAAQPKRRRPRAQFKDILTAEAHR